MSAGSPSLIILPTYNEAENIVRLIDELALVSKKISGNPLDILVVDDKSPDGTARLVRQQEKKYHGRVHLISGRREGLGRAYVRGFEFALTDGRFNSVVMMDADFSHDPWQVPLLLNALEQGSDYAIGSRYINGGKVESWPRARKLQSFIANTFARVMLDMKHDVRDLTGGFKAIRVSALEKVGLDSLKASGYVFQVNLLHEFSKHGFRITEVPIKFKDRTLGQSKMRLGDVLEFVYLTYRLNPNSRARRLIRFCLVGVSGTLVNLVVLIIGVQIGLSPLTAFIAALEGSIISNFSLNHIYTFRAALTSPRTRKRDSVRGLMAKLVKYNLVALGGAAISLVVFYGLYHLGLYYVPADLLAIIAATGWNYFMSVRLVWKMVDE